MVINWYGSYTEETLKDSTHLQQGRLVLYVIFFIIKIMDSYKLYI